MGSVKIMMVVLAIVATFTHGFPADELVEEVVLVDPVPLAEESVVVENLLDNGPEEIQVPNGNQPQVPVGTARITCDILSIGAGGVSLNHSACAAHCLLLGRRGGYCNSNAVCICR